MPWAWKELPPNRVKILPLAWGFSAEISASPKQKGAGLRGCWYCGRILLGLASTLGICQKLGKGLWQIQEFLLCLVPGTPLAPDEAHQPSLKTALDHRLKSMRL